jgi:hypothetical protein
MIYVHGYLVQSLSLNCNTRKNAFQTNEAQTQLPVRLFNALEALKQTLLKYTGMHKTYIAFCCSVDGAES